MRYELWTTKKKTELKNSLEAAKITISSGGNISSWVGSKGWNSSVENSLVETLKRKKTSKDQEFSLIVNSIKKKKQTKTKS